MKLLILLPSIPYPLDSGGNQIFFQLINRLRKCVDISIIIHVINSDSDKMESLKSLWENVTFHFYIIDQKRLPVDDSLSFKILNKIRVIVDRKLRRKNLKIEAEKGDLVRLNSRLKYNSSTLSEEYINFVYEVTHSTHFDLIEANYFELIDIVNILPKDIRKVFIQHEIRYVRGEQELSLLQECKPFDVYRANLLKKYEIQNLNAYDAVVTVTDIDKAKMESVLNDDILIETSPAIVDVPKIDFSEAFRFADKLIYVGGSVHIPNLDAIDWFLENCWEEIIEIRPQLQFHIIGQWDAKLKEKYTSRFENVVFKGFVEDLTAEIFGSVLVVPLRIGSGVRIKILDAISQGVPLVSTSVGAEGIMLEDGKDCLIADDKDEFIKAVLTLAGDDALCNKLRINARKKMEQGESPDQLADRRLKIYEKILTINPK